MTSLLLSSMIVIPRDDDILCAKNREAVQHPGSCRFREIINSYGQKYKQALTKYDKMSITREIYEKVKQHSRFLKFDEVNQVWIQISDTQGRDKVGHALRFANRTVRRTTKTKHRKADSTSSEGSGNSSGACVAPKAISSPVYTVFTQSTPIAWDSLVGHIQNSVITEQEDVANCPKHVLALKELASNFSASRAPLEDEGVVNCDSILDDLLSFLRYEPLNCPRGFSNDAEDLWSLLNDPLGDWEP